MAAGTGTRLRPYTDHTPKGMISVNGVPIIERQIRNFLEIGASEIVIVTGYLAERFVPLAREYDRLTFIHNAFYERYNNIYSMYLAREFLGESYVSEADVLMHRNYLSRRPERSLLFGGFRRGFGKEWILRFDESRRVRRVDVMGGEGVILAGLSYWTEPDARLLRTRLEEMVGGGNFETLFWDDVYMSCLDRVPVFVQEIEPSDWTEIDTPDDLREAEIRERND